MKHLIDKPIFFEKNRVGRVYRGGSLFAGFFGDNSTDGYMPEEWIASTVQSEKGNQTVEIEGLSKVSGTEVFFRDLVESYKNELIGERNSFDVLTKVLDSAVRLPVQAHPTKEFSRKYFHSEYGKTEMWLILATRENASVYFGFKEGVTREQFYQAIEDSEADKNAMPSLLNKLSVKTGDVFLIPAGVIHAIGAGCLVLEAQEPSDFTIEPESWCDSHHLSEEEMYMGLPKDIALKCFNFDITKEEVEKISRPKIKIIEKGDGYTIESLVSYENTDCFAMNRYTLIKVQNCDKIYIKSAPCVFLVIDGEGEITGESYSRKITKGEYFFMPYQASGKFYLKTDIFLQLAEIFPSKV